MHARRLAQQHAKRHVNRKVDLGFNRGVDLRFNREVDLRVNGKVDFGFNRKVDLRVKGNVAPRALRRRHRARCWRQVHVAHHQLALVGSDTDDRKRAALALAQRAELRQRRRRDRQHIALLAFVAPDLLGREAAFFQRHPAQIKARTAACVVGEFRKSIGQATCAHVVDGQDGVVCARSPAVVDDLLRAALDLGVAALHRIKIQLRRIGAGRHRAGGAAAHADAHARPPQLDQQAAGREGDLVGLCGVDRAQAASDHDGLVVAAAHAVDVASGGLLVFPKIAEQVGPAEFVVEGRATQRALQHDLQRAGNMGRTAVGVRLRRPQPRHREAGEPRLGLGAPARGALVPDLATRASGGTGKRRNRSRVVMGFDLHQHMLQCAAFLIAVSARGICAGGRFGTIFINGRRRGRLG